MAKGETRAGRAQIPEHSLNRGRAGSSSDAGSAGVAAGAGDVASADRADLADRARVDVWVHQAQQGDPRAVDALIRRFERPVRVLGMRLLGLDLAEDLAQEVFFRMVQGLPRFRGESRFSTWLFGIAYRTAHSMRRRGRRPAEQTVDLELVPDVPAPGDDAAEAQALRATVEWALARIRPQHRDAVVLHYLRELSLAEMAEVLGVPEATAKVYLFRGRRELYRLLEKEGGFKA